MRLQGGAHVVRGMRFGGQGDPSLAGRGEQSGVFWEAKGKGALAAPACASTTCSGLLKASKRAEAAMEAGCVPRQSSHLSAKDASRWQALGSRAASAGKPKGKALRRPWLTQRCSVLLEACKDKEADTHDAEAWPVRLRYHSIARGEASCWLAQSILAG